MNYDFFFKASRSQSTTQSPAVLICCLLIRNTRIISYCFSLLAVTTAAAALQLFCYQQQGKLSCDDCAKQSTSEEPIFKRKPNTPTLIMDSISFMNSTSADKHSAQYVLPSWSFPCFHGTFGNSTSYQHFSSHQLLLLFFSQRNSTLMVTVLI